MPVPTLDGVCTHTALSQRVVITQTTECDRCCESLHGRRKCEYINIGLVLRPHLMFGETAPTWKRCCREAVQFAEDARVLTECEARTGGANRRPLGRRGVVAGVLQLHHLC